MRSIAYATAACLFVVSLATKSDQLIRGRELHDNGCVGCHGSDMYLGEQRGHNPYYTVRLEVKRWSEYIGLEWDDAAIDAVTAYLETTYYRCGEARC